MKIYKNYSLKEHNGFAVDVQVKYFVVIEKEGDVALLLQEKFFQKEQKKYILGDGYNTIFAGDYNGVIIKNNILGIEKISEDENEVIFKVGSGEDWHQFVKMTVENSLAGLEKMALIPGQVGAAPFGNIAAYGQVQEDVFVELEAINLKTGEKKVFSREECEFAYRTSYFKNNSLGKDYLIIAIKYKFEKVGKIIPGEFFQSRYEFLGDFLDYQKLCTVQEIFEAIIKLRNSKLPKVEEWGTLGSIFMNPIIKREKFLEIQKRFPEIQYYPAVKMVHQKIDKIPDLVKIPIGWILEELGWKNKWQGKVGTYQKHSLLVVTKKGATWQEILAFIEEMKKDIRKEIGLELEPEIRIVK